MSATQSKSGTEYIESLPEPAAVREDLARTLREANALRKLLKLCETKYRSRRQESSNTADSGLVSLIEAVR